MKFYLIRHGQTAWNVENRVMGRADTPLDATGEKQVKDLANALESLFPFKLFFQALS
jgi:broad specificity phosphatase PhoE